MQEYLEDVMVEMIFELSKPQALSINHSSVIPFPPTTQSYLRPLLSLALTRTILALAQYAKRGRSLTRKAPPTTHPRMTESGFQMKVAHILGMMTQNSLKVRRGGGCWRFEIDEREGLRI